MSATSTILVHGAWADASSWSNFQKAVHHASRPGKTGIVLLKSQN